MKVVSKGELRAAGVPWQPRPGAFALTVVAKATFDLRPVLSPLAEQQDEPNEDDNHWDDDPARSVYGPSDLAPFKSRADVVLVGDAFAPHRHPVRSLVVRLVVAGIDKSIEVVGNRAYAASGEPHEPQAFIKLSLRYERAATGAGDNPVGLPPDHAQAPNLLPPGAEVHRGVAVPSVGFGPIAAAWPARANLLARAGGWSIERLGSAPVPEQLSSAFFNVAPADQQVARLAVDEHLVLENLGADHPLLVTNLPGVGARAFAARGGDLEEVKLVPDTLWIDATRGIVTLTFRGQLALRARDEEGTVFVLTELAQRPLTWSEVQRACADPNQEDPTAAVELPSIEGTIDSSDLATNVRRALPFLARPRQTSAPAGAPRIVVRDKPLPSTIEGIERDATATELPMGLADASPPWLAGPSSSRSVAVSAVVAPIASSPPPLAASPLAASVPRPTVKSSPPPAPVAPPPPVALVPPPAHVAAPPISPPAVLGPIAPPPASVRATGHRSAPPDLPADPGSALLASNAAAQPKPAAEPVAEAARAQPGARSSVTPRDLIELLWFDEAVAPPLRKVDRWKGLVASLQPKKPRVAYDDDPIPEEPAADRDRRDVFGVVALAATETPEELEALVDGVAGERGMFAPPLATVVGEVSFPFDELETLRATMTSVAPFAAGDKKLKELADTVNELLSTPWLRGSGAVADGLLQRVREAFAAQNRALPPGHLDAHTERILLAERHFQRRTVFGAPHLRAVFIASPNATPTIVYLPEALANKLPMYQRLRVRMLVFVNSTQDQFEASPLSLRCVAFARLTTPARRR